MHMQSSPGYLSLSSQSVSVTAVIVSIFDDESLAGKTHFSAALVQEIVDDAVRSGAVLALGRGSVVGTNSSPDGDIRL